MLTLGTLSFTAPWLLAGLLALPAIWWLLRITPPAPRRVPFPAIRLLLGLNNTAQTPAHTPWWLFLLRLSLAAMVILALAGPVFNAVERISRDDTLVLVVDNGWSAAPGWSLRTNTLRGLIDLAERQERAVVLFPLAGPKRRQPSLMQPSDARAAHASIRPMPYPVDHRALLDEIKALGELVRKSKTTAEIIWLSDGLDHGLARRIGKAFLDIGTLEILTEPVEERAWMLGQPVSDVSSLTVPVMRAAEADTGPAEGAMRITAADGRVLARESFTFTKGAPTAEARFAVPAGLLNDANRIELEQERSAGSVILLDESWRRRPVGLVSGQGGDERRPLLADLYFLERALSPYAELRFGGIDELLAGGLSVLVLSDVGNLTGTNYDLTRTWVERGGVLIRFAGPRFAGKSDDLIPVPLRTGGRALGGALSWETPQGLMPFEPGSPFYGLEVPEDVTVSRQVLAQPGPELADRTWARLMDGTPLVTAARRGDGWIVLFHITANQDWSSLPISGLYVEMIRRVIDLSQGLDPASGGRTGNGELVVAPYRVMDGMARLTDPAPENRPLAIKDFDKIPDTEHPPGLYGQAGSERAFNLAGGDLRLALLPDISPGAIYSRYIEDASIDLKPWLLGAAFLLALADGLVALILPGLLPGLRLTGRRGAAATGLLVAAMAATLPAADARAADQNAVALTRETHLAYVKSGNAQSDRLSRMGLEGLNKIITDRTAFEPGPPIGVDVESDELVFFPLIYWRITGDQKPISPTALVRIDAFMKSGGTIFFDTADHGDRGAGPSRAQQALRTLLADLDIPPLTPVPEDHVLRRTFYLLKEFPGRYAGGQIWVEDTGGGDTGRSAELDGVSTILIGSNDWAAAWARDANNQPMAAVIPGGERQREMAYRVGVNLVMYTLTGNYKADQMHVKAILERIGQ